MITLEEIADEKTSCAMTLLNQRQLSAWKANVFMQLIYDLVLDKLHEWLC
jgi:hypothetical protein